MLTRDSDILELPKVTASARRIVIKTPTLHVLGTCYMLNRYQSYYYSQFTSFQGCCFYKVKFLYQNVSLLVLWISKVYQCFVGWWKFIHHSVWIISQWVWILGLEDVCNGRLENPSQCTVNSISLSTICWADLLQFDEVCLSVCLSEECFQIVVGSFIMQVSFYGKYNNILHTE